MLGVYNNISEIESYGMHRTYENELSRNNNGNHIMAGL